MFCVVQGIGERSVGIYVKKVMEGSAAHRDGRLGSGDQLLSVNGQSLIGISQEEAASKMSSSGPIVSFEVYKHAARYNGLYEWLNNPPSLQAQAKISSVKQAGQLPLPDKQLVMPNSAENIAVNNNLANTQRFSRQNSAASTTSNYSNQAQVMQPNLMKPVRNGYPGAVTINACPKRPQHNSATTTDQQLVKSRSASTSDIYHNPVDKSLTVSLTSLQPSSGGTIIPVQSERYQTNTISSQRSTLPSHYRNVRPIVIQPSRPTHSPTLRQQQQQQYHSRSRSPSHLYATSTSSSSGHYHNPASDYVLSSASSSPITDYANLPLIEDHHSTFESSFSSTSSRNILSNQRPFPYSSTQQQFETLRTFDTNSTSREQNSIPSTSSHDSTRSSITTATQETGVAMDECSTDRRRFTKKAPPVPPKRHVTRRDELNEQLDELESKGAAMTEADHQKYRELVNELAKIRVPFPIHSISNKNTAEQDNPKFISSENTSSANDTEHSKSGKYEKASIKSRAIEIEKAAEQKKQDTIGVESGEVLKENKCSSPADENCNEKLLMEKGIQWDDKIVEKIEKSESDNDSKLIYDDDDQPEPRAQVLGTHEVYRDPRQLRLIEMEAKQHAAKEAKIDGSKLGFRDKMQLFAEQIGEKALKNRYKASTIQREIEQTLGDS
uniref:PDZ domain-containing protein n=1 Tax=Setaria digitata TaxID=48799 RepID=A0A915PT04_9BILA